jgi:hypothetical protein
MSMELKTDENRYVVSYYELSNVISNISEEERYADWLNTQVSLDKRLVNVIRHPTNKDILIHYYALFVSEEMELLDVRYKKELEEFQKEMDENE